jgi:hypothetical protein
MALVVTDEEAIEKFRANFRALNPVHCTLLDICLERTKPGAVCDGVNHDCLSHHDLRQLSNMVKVELLAGMGKSMDGTEEASENEEPHPFDIFLMKQTMVSVMKLSRPRRLLSLCLPAGRKLLWYDGFVDVTQLEKEDPKRRVASLSGAARVVTALDDEPSTGLKGLAMRRQGLVKAVSIDPGADAEKGNLNYSQRQAVATIVSPTFRRGFFAIQGPPGCGSKYRKDHLLFGHEVLNAIARRA